jgi:hypothetical protein
MYSCTKGRPIDLQEGKGASSDNLCREKEVLKLDGFVKSPSAALRFTPALLDQKPRIEGLGRGFVSERKIHLGVFLTG